MSAASRILGLVGAVAMGGMPLGGVSRTSSGTYDVTLSRRLPRGYQVGQGYSLAREQARRVRQMQRIDQREFDEMVAIAEEYDLDALGEVNAHLEKIASGEADVDILASPQHSNATTGDVHE